MSNIGIIGAGVGGLHLALYLQQHGVSTTLYAERTPAEQRVTRLPNTAGHWSLTRARERELGVNHWDEIGERWGIRDIETLVYVGPEPLRYVAKDVGGIAVDQRMISAQLIEDFQARGGDVVFGTVKREELEDLSERHDLVVVSSGRGSLTELFPRREKDCPFTQPQRLLCTAIYTGHKMRSPTALTMNEAPGKGELFEVPYITFDGEQTALFFEIVPGGPLEPLMQVRYDDDPQAFERTVLDALEEAFPNTRERIDESSFGVTAPHNVLQGAITPTARHGLGQLDNGRWVLALGDVHVVQDPIMGQGVNAASHCAFKLGEAIVDDPLAFDELWCRRIEGRMWDWYEQCYRWNNYMLQLPMPLNVVKLLIAGSQDPRISEARFLDLGLPERNWNLVASDTRTDAFLRGLGYDTDAILPPGMGAPTDASPVMAGTDER